MQASVLATHDLSVLPEWDMASRGCCRDTPIGTRWMPYWRRPNALGVRNGTRCRERWRGTLQGTLTPQGALHRWVGSPPKPFFGSLRRQWFAAACCAMLQCPCCACSVAFSSNSPCPSRARRTKLTGRQCSHGHDAVMHRGAHGCPPPNGGRCHHSRALAGAHQQADVGSRPWSACQNLRAAAREYRVSTYPREAPSHSSRIRG